MLQYWKQFLYVSLLMVLMGPSRDPFFCLITLLFSAVFWILEMMSVSVIANP